VSSSASAVAPTAPRTCSAVRFPVTANAQRTLRRELALLEDLAPALPLPIPVFAHVGRRDGRLVFVGYRAIRGEPLTHERLSALPAVAQQDILASLAAFLKALRAYPVSAARRAGVTEQLTSDAVRAAGRRPQARPCPPAVQQAADRLREHLHNH
jgi:hypothetical protein